MGRPPSCHDCCCADPMIVICIYDESDPRYTSCSGTYVADREAWEELIDSTDSTIRLGIIIPGNEEFRVFCSNDRFPYDSDRDIIDRAAIGFLAPRVLRQQIIDMFERIRTNNGNGPDLDVELLLFVLDNSGSIRVNQYAGELAAAKITLKDTYPKMEILDDISNVQERWLRDARLGTEGQTCK